MTVSTSPPRTRSQALPADEPLAELEAVAHFDGVMSTGVRVSHQGRVFVNEPRWVDDGQFTVAELRDSEATAYPDGPSTGRSGGPRLG